MLGYEEIRRRHGAEEEPPRFIVRRGRLIIALCLRAEANPKIFGDPAEVWVEAREHVEPWAERLSFDTGAVPIYLSTEDGGSYKDLGIYYVVGSTDDPVELAKRMACPNIERLSRIIFLSGPHDE